MLKTAITFLFIFSCLSIGNAQQGKPKDITLSGTVIDAETKQPLEYATVSLFSKKLNKIITGGITNAQGAFKIDTKSGIYNILIEYISFKTKTFEDQQLSLNKNLGQVELELDVEALGEVEIIAEKTTVEIKLDKKIYNVGKDLTIRGGTVSDVLDNVPSVSVDVEGNVALRGNQDVRILINGKPSGLVGLNSTDALRQLPAESIEKVEVITSPSARYDAEGTAGILNIILRRSKLQGLNGAITANVGYNPSAGISGNINYRTGDFNFFNTTGYNYREVPGNSYISTQRFNQEFDDNGNLIADNPDSFITESRTFDRKRKGINTNFGVEWYVNNTASITTSVVYRDSDNENNTENTINNFNENRELVNTFKRFDPEAEDDRTLQYSLNFDKQFNGNSQHKLTADFQYENSTEDEISTVIQNNEISEDVRTLETQDRILLQADYVHPLSESAQFELGYRGNFNTLDTDYILKTLLDGELTLNTNQTNTLVYTEDINAVYTQYGNKIKKKFSYLLGLRLEDTRIGIDQKTSNDFSKKQYTELFPTVNLSYELNDKESISLGFNRRIRRPRSFFINPFPSRSSATSIFQGNPDIDPSFSNVVDLGYLTKLGKVTLNGSVYYNRSTDIFEFISDGTDNYYSFETNETYNINQPDFDAINAQYQLTQVLKRTPINLSSRDSYGAELTLNYRPSRKWNLNANINVFKFDTKGTYRGQDFGASNTSWFARLNNKFTLPGNIDWQTRLFYRGPSENAQNKYSGIFSANLAFSKDLFKDKASLAFSVSDLFNSRKRIIDTATEAFNSDTEFQWRERSFNLSFTYRFNQKKKRQGGRNGNGGEDFGFE